MTALGLRVITVVQQCRRGVAGTGPSGVELRGKIMLAKITSPPAESNHRRRFYSALASIDFSRFAAASSFASALTIGARSRSASAR
jgi:hypothetical protein